MNEDMAFDDIIEYDSDTSGYIGEITENEDLASNSDHLSITQIAEVIQFYKCKRCDFIHSYFKVLERHFVTEHLEQQWPDDISDEEGATEILLCSVCYSQHRTIDSLRQHMIAVHDFIPIEDRVDEIKTEEDAEKTDDNIFDEKSAKKNDGIENDNRKIIKPMPFRDLKVHLMRNLIHKCSLKGCCFKFQTLHKLNQHLNSHVSKNVDEIREFKCLECDIEMKTWRACTSHMWKQHKIDIDLLKCPFCTYKSVTAIKIWRHLKTHKNWRVRNSRKQKSKKQKLTKHKPTNRWYSEKTCDTCGRTFANAKTLSKHVKFVHNKIKPFICNICGRKAARKTTLMVHMRQHTGEKPLECDQCPFKASDPSVMTKHTMRHNNETRYDCEFCLYSAIQSAALKAHLKTNHPNEYKRYGCDQCKFVSINAKKLSAHKQDHRNGLIKTNEDSCDAVANKRISVSKTPEKLNGNVEISQDCFLPIESTDPHDPPIDTGGVTIPAHSEDTQFPNFINH